MKGLEISRKYYEEYGAPMLESEFSGVLKYIAVGLVGSGSERYGFDDEISVDHDFEPSFCIFLPDESVVDRRTAFLLERAYAKLPKEFMGLSRQLISPVGGSRSGVIRTADFYKSVIGSCDGNFSVEEWLYIPDYCLAEAVNGEIFTDNYGEFTKIRNALNDMPRDAKLKRLAGNILLMAQSGQYNFFRCIKHGEAEAAQLAANEFINSAMKVLFLLNGKYMPYYKWSFRAFKSLPDADMLYGKLSFLLFGNNNDNETAERKYIYIEEISSYIIEKLKALEITKATCKDLEKHAYSINDFITDGKIRNLNIFAAT